MIWVLVRKELLSNLLTLRLGVALIFTVMLSVLTSLIGSLDYSQGMDAYRAEVERVRTTQAQVTVYSKVHPHIFVPPQPLTILCRGLVRGAGQGAGIEVKWIPASVGMIGPGTGQLMKTLVHIDFTTVVAVLLSFLAVVLGFDGICGERERGTLRQMLANPVPRGIVVIAKLIGGMLSLWIPLAVAFGLALLVLLGNPDVAFVGEDWTRLGALFVLSCLFLGQIFALSLMASTFTRSSATSLILCLSGWLAGGVGYMNVLPSLAQYGVKGRPWQEFKNQQNDVWRWYEREIEVWEARHPHPAQAYLECIEQDGILRYGHPKGYAWHQQRNAFVLDKQLELARRVYKLLWASQETPAREVLLVDRWSILSPFTNYKVLAKKLARSTLDDHFFLAKAVRRYREKFIEYLRGKKAFSSRRWFTDDPVDQEPMIPHPEEVTEEMLAPSSLFMKARMTWVEQQEAQANRDARRRLDLSDLPKFGDDVQRSLTESLMVMTPGLAVLLLTFGLSVMVAFVRFLRYDPR